MNRFSMTVGFVLFGAAIGSPTTWAQEPPKAETAPAKPEAEGREVSTESDDYLLIEGEAKGFTVKSGGPEDPTKPTEKPKVVRQTLTIQTPSGKQSRTIYKLDPLFHNFGLSLLEADDALRAQLEIPAGEGVVIVTVRPSSLAHDADLRANDVILSLAGKPAKTVAEVSKKLLSLTREALPVKLIREGKPRQLSVVGPEHGIMPEAPTEFWIGVPVSEVDATLRAHLHSEVQDGGLIANDVVKDSPAEAAGLKKNDILLTVGGSKLLKDAAGLIAAVQASEGKAVPVEILRAGKRLTLTVTPAKRKQTSFVFTSNGTANANQIMNQFADQWAIEIDKRSLINQVQAHKALQDQIQLRLQTKRPQSETETQSARVEAQLKGLSAQLDEIKAMLDRLKKSDGK